MGASLGVIKTLVVPALISLIIYLASTYIIVPLWQRYRIRSTYLPIAPSLDAISTHTGSLWAEIQHGLGTLIFRAFDRRWAFWRRDDYDEDDGLSLDGEELGTVPGGGSRNSAGGGGGRDDVRRLSRDLEEGFMDDSDDDEREAHGRPR
ncbi:hypothetical protein DL546_007691 [Coniochaeta pulveracea]|uniref:Uncharacterized protein n=1 Tax=Coniochaeta pulveracea TaxID=177199 RepID=A0A420YAU4_9PEZI|nr:hypothetical protein DL546_007691 [Coniochaeta pulveracea]